MIYKILIKGATGMQYATQKVEIVEKQIVDDEIVEVGTGKFKTETFATNDKDAVKARYIELLNQYKVDDLDVVADMKEIVTITVEIEDPDKKEEQTTPPSSDDEGSDTPGEGTDTPTPPTGDETSSDDSGTTTPGGDSADGPSDTDPSTPPSGTTDPEDPETSEDSSGESTP